MYSEDAQDLSNEVTTNGFESTDNEEEEDHTLFIKYFVIRKLTILLVYVYNMIIVGDNETKKLTLKEKMET